MFIASEDWFIYWSNTVRNVLNCTTVLLIAVILNVLSILMKKYSRYTSFLLHVALHHLLTNGCLCSEWVPSEWESKQLIKNITIIHTTPVHQLMTCEVKSKIHHKYILTKNCHFWIKYTSIIMLPLMKKSIMLFSRIKIHPHTGASQ